MYRPRIFWYHPQLRDYRKPLFDKMHQCYDLVFFFQERSVIPNEYRKEYSVKNGHKRRRIMPWRDVMSIYQGIKQSDVFISSFLMLNYTLLGIILSTIMRKKKVIWEETWHVGRSPRDRIKLQIIKLMARLCDSFFVMGAPQENMLLGMGVPREKIFVANEYPGQIYHKIIPRKISELEHLESIKVILYIGRFIEVKGVEYLLHAYEKVRSLRKDAVLLIIGYGPLESKLIMMANLLNLEKVFFHEPIFDIEGKAYLFNRLADIVVVPSIIAKSGEHEGGPLVVLEALSAGCAVVGTNMLGNIGQFVIDGKNGFIVPHSDSSALCKALDTAIDLLNQAFAKDKVLRLFEEIKGHDLQFKRMREAIAFALRGGE
jgi:glycosyltransferase involved in cell wall biosynthesis